MKYLLLIFILIITGCKVRQPRGYNNMDSVNQVVTQVQKDSKAKSNTKPYYLRFKPIVGSRQNDSKVVVDMGKVLKIWVAPYKSKGTMISSHDIYTWVQKPGFIVGEDIPNKNAHTGLTNAAGTLPFIFSEGDIDTSKGLTNNVLKKYVNNVYKAQNNPSYTKKRIDTAKSRFDDTIKQYLKTKGRE